jgi:tetratricopeptide (TPR) repeat protein
MQRNATEGAAMLEQSVGIDPHDALAWLELSRAYGIGGQSDKQHEAILRALAADPKDVGVEWDASIHLIQTGDVDGALTLIRDLINNDPSKAAPGMQVAFGATGGDVARTLKAIPPTAQARVAFMRWLVDRGEAAGADHVWPTVANSGSNLFARDLAFYIDSLVARHEVPRA